MREPFNKINLRSKRGFKIADHIRKTVSELLRAKVRDPRVNAVTITDVEITYDVSIAKIFYSVYPWSENNLKDARSGLHSAKKFIRMQLGKELTCYRVPELNFKLDTSLDHGDKINQLLNRVGE